MLASLGEPDMRPAPTGAPTPTSVAEWIEAARAGSQLALGELLQTCRQYLLLVAHSQMKGPLQAKAGASDLVQETFLKAQEHFGHFAGHTREELLAWLRQILRNILRDYFRRYRTTEMRQLTREVSLDAGTGPTALEERLPAPSDPPADAVIRAEEARALYQALEWMPPDYRQVIVLRNWQGYSFVEIGQLMSRSEEAARKLWARGIEYLQQQLTSPYGHD